MSFIPRLLKAATALIPAFGSWIFSQRIQLVNASPEIREVLQANLSSTELNEVIPESVLEETWKECTGDPKKFVEKVKEVCQVHADVHNVILAVEGLVLMMTICDLYATSLILKESHETTKEAKTLLDLKAKKFIEYYQKICHWTSLDETARINVRAKVSSLCGKLSPLLSKLSRQQGKIETSILYKKFILALDVLSFGASLVTLNGFSAFSFGQKLLTGGLTAGLGFGTVGECVQIYTLKETGRAISSYIDILADLNHMGVYLLQSDDDDDEMKISKEEAESIFNGIVECDTIEGFKSASYKRIEQ